jgi:hypothetical protein
MHKITRNEDFAAYKYVIPSTFRITHSTVHSQRIVALSTSSF